ncbi:lon proteinase, partial [Trichophyton equinum CBS 127.97]
MFRGISLPLRAALRRSSQDIRYRAYNPRFRQIAFSHSDIQASRLQLSRGLSSTPARRKEKPSPPQPKKDEVEAEREEKIKPEEPTEGKNKSDEPSPIPPSEGKSDSRPSHGAGAGAGAGGSLGSGGGDGGRRGRKGSSEKALQKPTIPDVYPQVMAIPIARRPLFPGFYKAITIKDPNVVAAIQEMMKRGQPYVGAFLFKDEAADKDVIDNIDEVHDVGVFAQITSAFPVHGDESGLTAVLYPHRRIKMTSILPSRDSLVKEVGGQETSKDSSAEKQGDVVASFEEGAAEQTAKETTLYEPSAFLRKYPVSIVNVDNLVEEPMDKKSPVIRAVTSEIVNVFKDVANLNPLFRDQISTFSMSQSAGNVIEEPAKLADFAAAVSAGEIKELQDVLETMNVEERLSKALVVLKKELMNAQLQSKISKDVEAKIQKRQREYWLMEQMKGIRRELGIESDGKDKLVEKFKEKAEKLAMPDVVRKVFDEELNKLAHLEPAASEFNVTRNYLDWITQIPWGKRSEENFGIKNAMKVLDEDHYGLKDVKDRILEFIAVGKLRGT